ncbi:hypothetical protein [Streptomyces chartreusis]|uniref:hypothetical protein n=1 Tax=Streptomyces chartreusis TaxID=1969 RepID=UPI00210071F5|nr:hypothetical protein [Streptomyces chartreusis]
MRRGTAPELPHALVPPADPEDDGVVGEQHEDQEHGTEPARPPLSEARAQEMTAGLREAMDDVRRSVAVLAARVRDAHAARVWVPLGHPSWRRRTGSWTSPAPSPRSTTRSPPAPRRLARETPARPPRPRSTTDCPSAP